MQSTRSSLPVVVGRITPPPQPSPARGEGGQRAIVPIVDRCADHSDKTSRHNQRSLLAGEGGQRAIVPIVDRCADHSDKTSHHNQRSLPPPLWRRAGVGGIASPHSNAVKSPTQPSPAKGEGA